MTTRSPARPFIQATPGKVVPRGKAILYSQNSNDSGGAVLSQNFTSGSFASYDSQSADDFVVPAGHKWAISEVDVTGVYFNGSPGGPASSEHVFFYKDAAGLPGTPIKDCNNLVGKEISPGSFNITLPKGCRAKLAAGTYWVSVQINMSFVSGAGEWGIGIQTTQEGNPAAWQNPGGGFGVCPTWGNQFKCTGDYGPTIPGHDDLFALKGKVVY
jgi:hypothetical protein